jgi:hypothetical protein
MAGFDAICNEMDRNPRNGESQIKNLTRLVQLLREEREMNRFQRAFQSIAKASKANANDEKVQIQVLFVLEELVQDRSVHARLEATNVFSILMDILSTEKDHNALNEMALRVTARTIAIPRIGPHFSSQKFVDSLVYIARMNPKSRAHATHIANIAKCLTPRLPGLKDFFSF